MLDIRQETEAKENTWKTDSQQLLTSTVERLSKEHHAKVETLQQQLSNETLRAERANHEVVAVLKEKEQQEQIVRDEYEQRLVKKNASMKKEMNTMQQQMATKEEEWKARQKDWATETNESTERTIASAVASAVQKEQAKEQSDRVVAQSRARACCLLAHSVSSVRLSGEANNT